MRRAILLSICFVAGAASAQPLSPSQRIHGDVVALEGLALRLQTNWGEPLTVRLGANYTVSARSRADAALIEPGAFVGTTAIPRPDGTLSALEVHVFPESMRGTGEGHRPIDVAPGSTMTNATIASVDRARASSTTHATVTELASDEASRRMTFKYPGGEQIVVVTADTPIVMVEPGDRSMLAPGAHVVLSATCRADGTLTAERVTVGKNGFVPPM